MSVINSFSKYRNENILYPGVVLYENVLNFNKSDESNMIIVQNYIEEKAEETSLSKIKNTFFYGFNKINKKEFSENIQKSILYYFAKYCDIYPEVIHSIQWQENIYIDTEISGCPSFINNPTRSLEGQDGYIKNTPFSRQVSVEIFVNDNYLGGDIEFPYLNNLKLNKIKSGSILIHPANYLFSKNHYTIMDGRRILLTTFFNGGIDFLSEENGLDENSRLLFSYLR